MEQTKPRVGRELFLVFWGAFSASQVIYLAALAVMPKRAAALGTVAVEKVALALGACSLLALASAFFLPKLVLNVKPQGLSEIQGMTTEDANRFAIERGLLPYLLRLTCFEAICVLGFVAAFLTKNISLFLPFLGVSSLGLVMSFPSWTFLRGFVLKRA